MFQKLKRFFTPKNEHRFKQTLTVDIFYPDHPPRTESSVYRASRKLLIDEQDLPCWVCGTKESREAHHMWCEWADSEIVDWNKMRKFHPDFDWSTFKSPEDFIDSVYNLRILCVHHHRHKDHGIHMLPYPIWQAQRFEKEGFIFSPDEEVARPEGPVSTPRG